MQVTCLSDVCKTGYHRAVLSPEQALVTGDLEFGSEVCETCDELCDQCTGPGTNLGPNGCLNCSLILRRSQCVGVCNYPLGLLPP